MHDNSKSYSVAQANDYLKIVELLLSAGIDASIQDKNGDTALHWIYSDNTILEQSIVHAIVTHSGVAVLELKNKKGETALDVAKNKKTKNDAVVNNLERVVA